MSEIVERVAQAIYEGRNGFGAVRWSKRQKSYKEPYLKDARAAIDAMREPSREMMTAIGYPNYPDGWAAWGAMIDEALK